MAQLAERLNNLGSEGAFEVLAKTKVLEAQGKKIAHFEIGEPDFDTPENIRVFLKPEKLTQNMFQRLEMWKWIQDRSS